MSLMCSDYGDESSKLKTQHPPGLSTGRVSDSGKASIHAARLFGCIWAGSHAMHSFLYWHHEQCIPGCGL